MEELEITQEEIARHYSAMLDSVAVIKGEKPVGMEDEEWEDCIKRNKEHLEIMVAKDFWSDEDMSEINSVLA